MIATIAKSAGIALALLLIGACDRQESADSPRAESPATGSAGAPMEDSAAGDRTRSATQPSAAPGDGRVAQAAGQQQAERHDSDMHDQSRGMTDEERQAALRACERLQGQGREQCEREVRERSNAAQANPEQTPRDGQD